MISNIHLSFDGRCQEAFEFYKNQLGVSTTLMLSYGDSPLAKDVPQEWRDKIVHATLILDSGEISGTDVQPHQYQKPQGFSILLEVNGLEETQRVFAAFSEGGSIGFPLQKTFWSEAYGHLVDGFGIPWEINCANT
jgi:PhnB protein